MDKCWDILGLGVVTVDDLIYVEKYPLPDSKVKIIDEIRQGGGLTATALVAASRLGASTAYCAVLGNDELSIFSIKELEKESVDCSPVLRHLDARPVHSRIIVDQQKGDRTILFSFNGVSFPDPSEISPELIANCRVLLIDNYPIQAVLASIAVAGTLGIPVIADIESVTTLADEILLEKVDHLIINIELGKQITGEEDPVRIVNKLALNKRPCSLITSGKLGCWYSEYGSEVVHFPAYRVNVVDTTGCGDVFHGAYAACIAAGNTINQAIQIATASAGLKATRPGGRAGIPTKAEVDMFLTEVIHD